MTIYIEHSAWAMTQLGGGRGAICLPLGTNYVSPPPTFLPKFKIFLICSIQILHYWQTLGIKSRDIVIFESRSLTSANRPPPTFPDKIAPMAQWHRFPLQQAPVYPLWLLGLNLGSIALQPREQLALFELTLDNISKNRRGATVPLPINTLQAYSL